MRTRERRERSILSNPAHTLAGSRWSGRGTAPSPLCPRPGRRCGSDAPQRGERPWRQSGTTF
eukprot:485394-Pyramimonas_sp.AAC.1